MPAALFTAVQPSSSLAWRNMSTWICLGFRESGWAWGNGQQEEPGELWPAWSQAMQGLINTAYENLLAHGAALPEETAPGLGIDGSSSDTPQKPAKAVQWQCSFSMDLGYVPKPRRVLWSGEALEKHLWATAEDGAFPAGLFRNHKRSAAAISTPQDPSGSRQRSSQSPSCLDPGSTMDLTKMGAIQLQNPSHAAGLLQKANQMRLAGILCDVVILVDSQEFHAHRTVLACTSKMFEILFHRNSQHYTLDFLSPKTFQQILEYAYTATLQARVEDLDDLLYAAEILEIEYLEEQCLKILETIQASEDDAEAGMADGGAEEEEERRSKHAKHVLLSKHSSDESGYCSLAGQSLTGTLVEQSPSVSTSFGLSAAMSPTKAAIDSLMTIGQSLLQGALQPGAPEDGHHPGASDVKTESMQVEEGAGRGSPSTADLSAAGGDKAEDKGRQGPGTPTRSSVITSARELHYSRDENPEQPPEALQGAPPVGPELLGAHGEKPMGLYSVLPNHKSDSVLGLPSSMGPARHVQPALAVSMDFSAYGGLLPQGFIQRELFSKLGELAVGIKTESRAIGEQCSVCGADLPDNETVEQHRYALSGSLPAQCPVSLLPPLSPAFSSVWSRVQLTSSS
ncbi:hypothetical protein lerEdw1_007582 [Lerista edwardsae]|nr:hypothetical protein lerEdw1_007582 [Lerista edwardsae]